MAWWAWVLLAWAVVGGGTVVWFRRALAEAENREGHRRTTRACAGCPHDQHQHPGGARCSLCPCPRWTATRGPDDGGAAVLTLLWTSAVILVVAGVVTMFRGQLALGIALLVAGLLVGPGGSSILE